MSRMGAGFDWLTRQMESFAGIDITYRRGIHSAQFKAVPQMNQHMVDAEEQMIETYRSQDWTFDKNHLVLNSLPTEPELGDEIDCVLNGTPMTFVLAHVDDQNFFLSVDEDRAYRVHGARVS